MCTQKLTCIQLSLLQGTKQKIDDGKLNRNTLSIKIDKLPASPLYAVNIVGRLKVHGMFYAWGKK